MEGLSKPSQLVQRPTRSVVITILATLVGGALVGRLLAGIFAPGSELADTVGVLVFPFCLGGGYAAWRGFGAAIVMPRVARMLFTSRSRTEFARRLGEAAPEFGPSHDEVHDRFCADLDNRRANRRVGSGCRR